MTAPTQDARGPTPILLSEAERVSLFKLMSSFKDPELDPLRERINRGGDEIIVQAGIEGGVIQGWTANCPVTAIAIEWDEESHLVIDPQKGQPRLLAVAEGSVLVNARDAAERVCIANHAYEVEEGDLVVMVVDRSGRVGCAHVEQAMRGDTSRAQIQATLSRAAFGDIDIIESAEAIERVLLVHVGLSAEVREDFTHRDEFAHFLDVAVEANPTPRNKPQSPGLR